MVPAEQHHTIVETRRADRLYPSFTATMDPQLEQVINNKYRLVRLIGDGGMGSVFEARHVMLGTTVALKFLHTALARRSGLVDRFLQEAQVSARIKSPHVVRVTDVDRTVEGLAYMVMEYVEGNTLQDLYEQLYQEKKRLTYGEAFRYMRQILDGVAAAHSMAIVHRDLKPDNVMLTRDDHGETFIKLLDFGIAKLKASGEVDKGLTRPGVVMGTPEYMAPEQAFSADKVDARADIFSLGVMFFEMLAGRRPVGGDNALSIAAQYLEGQIAQLHTLAPNISRELCASVHKAMAPKPHQRFDSVLEFREAIAAFSPEGAPATAPAVNAGASPAVVPVAALAGSTPAAGQSPAPASPAPPSPAPADSGPKRNVPDTVPPEETFSEDDSATGKAADGTAQAEGGTAGKAASDSAPTPDPAAMGEQAASEKPTAAKDEPGSRAAAASESAEASDAAADSDAADTTRDADGPPDLFADEAVTREKEDETENRAAGDTLDDEDDDQLSTAPDTDESPVESGDPATVAKEELAKDGEAVSSDAATVAQESPADAAADQAATTPVAPEHHEAAAAEAAAQTDETARQAPALGDQSAIDKPGGTVIGEPFTPPEFDPSGSPEAAPAVTPALDDPSYAPVTPPGDVTAPSPGNGPPPGVQLPAGVPYVAGAQGPVARPRPRRRKGPSFLSVILIAAVVTGTVIAGAYAYKEYTQADDGGDDPEPEPIPTQVEPPATTPADIPTTPEIPTDEPPDPEPPPTVTTSKKPPPKPPPTYTKPPPKPSTTKPGPPVFPSALPIPLPDLPWLTKSKKPPTTKPKVKPTVKPPTFTKPKWKKPTTFKKFPKK